MDDEIQWRFLDMDDAFCARMRAAIEAGLESAPDFVLTLDYLPSAVGQRHDMRAALFHALLQDDPKPLCEINLIPYCPERLPASGCSQNGELQGSAAVQ